jgi:hypothetical protein
MPTPPRLVSAALDQNLASINRSAGIVHTIAPGSELGDLTYLLDGRQLVERSKLLSSARAFGQKESCGLTARRKVRHSSVNQQAIHSLTTGVRARYRGHTGFVGDEASMILPSALMIAPQLLFLTADDVPVLNVEPMCLAIAQEHNISGLNRDPRAAHNDCVKSEQRLHDQLAQKWSLFSAAEKMACRNEASYAGVESYTELLTCLEMARDVKTVKVEDEPKPTASTTGTVPTASTSGTDGVPSLNLAPMCLAIAQEHNATGLNRDPRKAYNDCLATEREIRDRLAKKWSAFPPQERRSCKAEVLSGGVESYTELLTCLELAADVHKLDANTHDR